MAKKSAKESPTTDLKKRAQSVNRRLTKLYPEAECALEHQNPLQLLIATILSAQCTDVRVNMVTPHLFARFPNANALAAAEQAELESIIRSTGFFRNKAKNIKACCQRIVEHFRGEVPRTMEELLTLPGVARKTANVVLGNAFGIPGLVVDTHVIRLSRRMGLTKHLEPVKIEADLMALLQPKEWTMFSHRMIFHGRQVCQARKPACDRCAIADDCPKIGVTR